MENVVAGMYVRELSPPVKAQHALLAQLASRKLAAPDAMQPARIVQGFAPCNGSQGILKKAQAGTCRCIPTSSLQDEASKIFGMSVSDE